MKNNTVIVLTSTKSDVGLPTIKGLEYKHEQIHYKCPENNSHPNDQVEFAKTLDINGLRSGMVLFTHSTIITQVLLNRKNITGEDIRFYFIDGNGMVYKDEDLDMFKDSWNDAFAWGLDVALGIVKNDINSYNLNKEV